MGKQQSFLAESGAHASVHAQSLPQAGMQAFQSQALTPHQNVLVLFNALASLQAELPQTIFSQI